MQRPAETHLPALAGESVSERGLGIRARPADPQLHLARVYLPVASRPGVAGEIGVHGELDGARAARRQVNLRGRDQLLDRPGHLGDRVVQVLDNPLGVALPEAAFGLPLTIVILRPFMREIPGELEDSAVDGATRIGFFLRILLPLSRGALVTVAVLAFVQSWNQYLIPLLVFTSQGRFTLPLAVANFQTQYAQNTAGILAFTALSMLPALGCFIFAQRHLVCGFAGRGQRLTRLSTVLRIWRRSTRPPSQPGPVRLPGRLRVPG
jgi:hypothetical protein